MPISIYNSLQREKIEFTPLDPGGKKVKMYVCGPTVYDQPHIGHARSAYVFDLVRRYLVYKGYEVTFVRNVTDVDDKIINKAQAEFQGEDLNLAVGKVSAKYLDLYHEDMRSLGILDPDVEPKATEYVGSGNPLMQKFIQQLIDKGCAYVAGGDVYFDIKKAKDYGKLSHQDLKKMEAGARIALGEKKNDPLDFALWKSAKPGEPAWDSPWGPGRPGWHIECSVMSSDILGDEFDIHGGGLDLIFPHHENEIAQSEGAGKKFARYWMHHGLLTINGQKMSKSLGNFITVKDFINKYKYPDLLKLVFLSTHYSHPVDYTEEKIEEAKNAYAGIINLMNRLDKEYGSRKQMKKAGAGSILQFKERFDEYMDDDFNTPRALSVLFEMVKLCNIELDSKDIHKAEKLNYALSVIKEMAGILGLNLLVDGNQEISNEEIESKILDRKTFKKEKKFAEADQIRKELEGLGIILEDTKEGTTWRKKI